MKNLLKVGWIPFADFAAKNNLNLLEKEIVLKRIPDTSKEYIGSKWFVKEQIARYFL